MKKLIWIGLLLFILIGCDASSIKPYLNPGQDTVILNQSWEDEGAYVLVGFNRIAMSTTDRVDTSQLGTQTVTYRLTYDEKTYVIKRNVQVVHSQDFDVSLAAGIDTIGINEIWIDAGIISKEDVSYEVIGVVDSSKEGVYRIEYHVTYQNQLKVIVRYVNVIA